MPRLVTFVNNDILESLQKLARQSRKSLSKVSAELLEEGFAAKRIAASGKAKKQAQEISALTEKNTEYLLRILGLTSDILRCVHNEKSKYKEKNMEDIYELIKNNAQTYIASQLTQEG